MNERGPTPPGLDTVARRPHGLDTPGQVSSAYDLALIARAALQLPGFRTYVSTLQATTSRARCRRPGRSGRPSSCGTKPACCARDTAASSGSRPATPRWPGAPSSGAAKRGGHTLVVTLMGVTEPTVNAASKLLTWGFRAEAHVTPVGTLVDPVADTVQRRPAPPPSR